MSTGATALIHPLFQSPLGGLGLTLASYLVATWLYQWGKQHPLLNPAPWATLFVVLFVVTVQLPYALYKESSLFIYFCLKPATVALAVPLHRHRAVLRQHWKPLLISLLLCAVMAFLSSVGLAWWLGASKSVLLSMTPKSVTAPIAMGVSHTLGGIPTLTIAFTMVTGLSGALFAPLFFKAFNIRHPIAQGFALGTVSHGIGTATAYHLSEQAGAFSGLGMALHGVLAAFLFPVIAQAVGLPLIY